jgi:hypothetical protein
LETSSQRTPKRTENKLSEPELDSMYQKIVHLLQSLSNDQESLTIYRLIIPEALATSFASLSHIKTNKTYREHRESMWLMDLLLCALNNSVVHPHFKGHKST